MIMALSLADFQDHFAAALLDAAPLMSSVEDQSVLAALTSQRGFAVYRNTVMKGCIDTLHANYPAVARLVGDEWFRAAAAIYARMHPPQDTRMLYYGIDFADFLANFEPAAELTYLPHVARLDRLWTDAHAARDEAPLDPAALAGIAPEALAGTVLHPHAAARWLWCADQPAYTIWHRNRSNDTDDSEIAWQGEGALLVRPHAAVTWLPLDAAGCAFMDACNSGCTLTDAANAAVAVQPDTDLAQLLATLLNAGAFGRAGSAPTRHA